MQKKPSISVEIKFSDGTWQRYNNVLTVDFSSDYERAHIALKDGGVVLCNMEHVSIIEARPRTQMTEDTEESYI